MIPCNYFSLCSHDSFYSSIIPSILNNLNNQPIIDNHGNQKNRLFQRLRFSKLFSLSLISRIAGCCCCSWCVWFCNNSFFKFSKILKFSSYWSLWNEVFFLVQILYFWIQCFLQLSHWFSCPFVQEKSWKSLLLIAHEFNK